MRSKWFVIGWVSGCALASLLFIGGYHFRIKPEQAKLFQEQMTEAIEDAEKIIHDKAYEKGMREGKEIAETELMGKAKSLREMYKGIEELTRRFENMLALAEYEQAMQDKLELEAGGEQ